MLQEYIQSYASARVGFIGAGVSNMPIIELFAAAGVPVIVRDRRLRDGDREKLRALGVELTEGDGYLRGIDEPLLFLSPAVRPDLPELDAARARGTRTTTELEEFFALCPCPILAVTGSDGKTTTTTLTAKLLEQSGKRVFLGGNIGKNLFARLDEIRPDDYAVAELSSFQLMKMTRSPDTAVVTNISPNHLDWHRDFDEYIAAKKRICASMPADGLLVLNYDNEHTRAFAASAGCRVRFFSRKNREAFCFIDGEGLHCGGRLLLPDGDIRLVGAHNRENYAAAYAATADLLADGALTAVARDFGGVEHRIEFVRQVRGVRYYNDSIASSPSRTIAGLPSFHQKLVLIAGGYDKKIPFDALGPEICGHVRLLILCGATAAKIRVAVESAPGYKAGTPDILEAHTLSEAVHLAKSAAHPGDIVTLSPACAAFDQFKNFAVRGNTYKQLVNAL